MSKVAIVGSGFVGRAWAISFARAGHEVALWDADAARAGKALGYIDGVLPDLAANDLLNGAGGRDARRACAPSPSLEEALDGRGRMCRRTRRRTSRSSARSSPGSTRSRRRTTVLASSTSAILPSAFTERLPGRARCLVVHPINPPYLIPAAEVVPAPWTDAAVVERDRRACCAPPAMRRS